MTKNTIISTFIALCADAKNPAELVRNYIKVFGEEIKKFGTAKVDDMNQPMVTLYNYIDSKDFHKECDDCCEYLWDFINDMVTNAETYVWHKDDEYYANDDRIEWIKEYL